MLSHLFLQCGNLILHSVLLLLHFFDHIFVYLTELSRKQTDFDGIAFLGSLEYSFQSGLEETNG
jgi:hypothetical protein